jgi:transcriptional regulator with XRE-family HTH domain
MRLNAPYLFPMGGFGKKHKQRTYVREWRDYRRLSQAALSERIGVAQATLSKLERGQIGYTQPMLEALADALSCSPADLIMRDPSQSNGLWTLINGLSDADRAQAAQIIETFKRRAS